MYACTWGYSDTKIRRYVDTNAGEDTQIRNTYAASDMAASEQIEFTSCWRNNSIIRAG